MTWSWMAGVRFAGTGSLLPPGHLVARRSQLITISRAPYPPQTTRARSEIPGHSVRQECTPEPRAQVRILPGALVRGINSNTLTILARLNARPVTCRNADAFSILPPGRPRQQHPSRTKPSSAANCNDCRQAVALPRRPLLSRQYRVGDAMEARLERLCHHLRRPVPGRRDLLTQMPDTVGARRTRGSRGCGCENDESSETSPLM
jgi:hypothetical protein